MAIAWTSDSPERDRMPLKDEPGAWTPLLSGWLGWIFFAGVLLIMVGALAVLIVLVLLTGNMVARGAAAGLASFSALASLAFVAATPAWAVIVIAVDVLVIFSIVVHGGELEKSSRPR